MKIVLSVVAGIGGVVALTVAYRKQGHGEAAENRENEKLLNDRFGRAADQLGSDKAAIRLAGAHAMAKLADDWEDGRQTCIDVLCACLRIAPPAESPADGGHGEREVRQTLLRIIRDHLKASDPADRRGWHGRTFDLTGAVLEDADLSGLQLSTGTTLTFTGAEFAGATSFDRIRLDGGRVDLRDATFGAETSFRDLSVSGGGSLCFDGVEFGAGRLVFDGMVSDGGTVSFDRTVLSGAVLDFGRATLAGGDLSFRGARISAGSIALAHVRVSGGTLTFAGADMSGGELVLTESVIAGGELSFRDATLSGGGHIALDGATFSAGAVTFAEAALLTGGSITFDRGSFAGAEVTFLHTRFRGGVVDLSHPRSWTTPPGDISASEPGVRWPGPEHLANLPDAP